MIKNVGFPLNLGQLRTSDYQNFTIPTPSGQKFVMKILIFSALQNLFCSRMGSIGRKLLRIIKNDPSKPKLMILRKFCFFSENFLKNFPILRCIRQNLVSKCSQRSHLYNEPKSSNGGRWSKILPLFFREKHRKERHHVVKIFFGEFF